MVYRVGCRKDDCSGQPADWMLSFLSIPVISYSIPFLKHILMSSPRYKDGSQVQEETCQRAADHLPSLLPPPRYLLRHHPLQGFLLRGRRHREPDRDAGLHHALHQVDHFWSDLYFTLPPSVWWRSCPPHPTSGWLISGWSTVSWFPSWRSSYLPSSSWREKAFRRSIITAFWGSHWKPDWPTQLKATKAPF